MKRFLFLILALLLAVSSVVSFGSSSVSAASVYDGLIQTTDNLVLSHSPWDSNPHVDSLDVSLDWYSQIKVSLDRMCSQYPNTPFCSFKPLYERLGSANNEDMKWLVSMIPGDFSYSVTFTDDPNAQIVFDVSNGVPRARLVGDYVYALSGSLVNPNSTTSDDGIAVGGSPSFMIMSVSSADNGVIFLSTFPIEYPDGYEGDIVPDTYVPTVLKRPNISFRIDDKKVTLWSRKSSNLDIADYKIKWLITNITTDEIQPDPIFTQEGYSLPDQQLEFEVPSYGNYMIYAQYSDPDGSVISKWGDYTLGQTVIMLLANGTVYEANTDDYDCDEDGYCSYTPPPLYEDCSVYSSDSNYFGWIGCQIGNFKTWLIQTTKWLFVPDFIEMNYEFTRLSDQFKTSMGLLWSPFDFIISTFQLFSGTVANPTGQYCSLGSFAMFGKNSSSIELCRWRDQFPQLWTLMQTILGAALSFAIAIMLFGLVKKYILHIDSSPDDLSDYEDTSGWQWVDERTGERGSIHDGSIRKRGSK